jgi:hypothetical protein
MRLHAAADILLVVRLPRHNPPMQHAGSAARRGISGTAWRCKPVEPNCVTRNSENLCPPKFYEVLASRFCHVRNSSRQFEVALALAAGTPTTATQRIPRRNPVLDARVHEVKEKKSGQKTRNVGLPAQRASNGEAAESRPERWRTVATKLATTSCKKHPETR